MKSHANLITDTVGAIAIDCFGNIAAGSSSEGAALKQRGRIGPAALVGIGTAVIPINPKDPQKACSASVASGTGDHMFNDNGRKQLCAACAFNDRLYKRDQRFCRRRLYGTPQRQI